MAADQERVGGRLFLEIFKEFLMVHSLKGRALVPKILMSTNWIESMFLLVLHSARNI